jgi:hypothetical protein
MNSKPVVPSIRRILWADYPAFISAALIVTAWVVYLFWAADPPTGDWSLPFLGLASALTLGSLGVIGLRVYQLRKVFLRGEAVRGQITAIDFNRDRGRAEYTFDYQGETYRASAPLHRHGRARALQVGEKVILMIDRQNPRRAFIRDLYR